MPKCIDRLSPAINSDGRFVTGIDEESLEINLIQDSDEKASRKKKVKVLRESLEKQTGKDLTGTSKFWETYMVELKSDNDLILNIANPTDVIKYNMLISNGYVAPSKQETLDIEMLSTIVFQQQLIIKKKYQLEKLKILPEQSY
jgi:hypothetical protein